jgi:hypothetical protein
VENGGGACLEIRSLVPAWLQNGGGASLAIQVGRRGLGRRECGGRAGPWSAGVWTQCGGSVGGSVEAVRGLGRAEAMGAAMREEGGDGGIFVG